MNWSEVKKQMRDEFFFQSISRMNQTWKKVYDYVKEESNITGIENCNSFMDYIPKNESGIGYYCVMGGDWEDPTAFILFLNKADEVWIKVVKENVGVMDDHISEESFKGEVEHIENSPIFAECECVGKVDIFEKVE